METPVETLKKSKGSWLDELFDWLESILFSFFAAVLLFTFVFRMGRVDGSSMIPTLHDKDRLLMSNILYTPENRDIVGIYSHGLKEPIVKRVIAVAGQEVDIDFEAGKIYVDGKEQFEPYIYEITKDDRGMLAAFDSYPVIVPEGHVFVLGDNRNDSVDSRDIRVGFVSEDDILGKVLLRVYPFKDFGFLE